MAVNLAALPLELQLNVAQYVEHPHDRRSLVLCSRHFYSLLLPVLYETLRFADHCRATRGTFAIVVQTVIRNPHLASSVRLLHLNGWDIREVEASKDATPNMDAYIAGRAKCVMPSKEGRGNRNNSDHARPGRKTYDFASIREKVRLASRSEAEENFWMTELQASYADAWVGLLLTLLPNLQRLELQFPYGTHFVPWVLGRAANRQFGTLPVLQSLTEAAVGWCDNGCVPDLRNVLHFFKFPSMRRLYGEMV